jgi:hypothetical protein
MGSVGVWPWMSEYNIIFSHPIRKDRSADWIVTIQIQVRIRIRCVGGAEMLIMLIYTMSISFVRRSSFHCYCHGTPRAPPPPLRSYLIARCDNRKAVMFINAPQTRVISTGQTTHFTRWNYRSHDLVGARWQRVFGCSSAHTCVRTTPEHAWSRGQHARAPKHIERRADDKLNLIEPWTRRRPDMSLSKVGFRFYIHTT